MRTPVSGRIGLLILAGALFGSAVRADTRGSETRTTVPQQAQANGLALEGLLGYVIDPNSATVRLTADRVRSTRTSGVSGTLQLRLWATTSAPVFGQTINAFVLGVYTLGQLNAGFSFTSIDSGLLAYSPPPQGTYFITMALMEFDGTSYGYQDFFQFSQQRTLGPLTTGCTPNSTTLCLNNGRFRVTTTWVSATASGVGNAVALTSDTGYFWFFSSNNVEMVVKAVNGCGFNSRYWVFAGGLTNVNVQTQVTDTATGQFRTYTNPLGAAFQPLQDTSAFATCP